MVKRRLRAPLPGSFFKRGRRWQWRVQLPGEVEEKARSLRREGERYGVTNLEKAREVALAMWQRAIEREGERRAAEKARIRAIRRATAWMRKVKEAKLEAEKASARRLAAYERRVTAYRRQARSWKQKVRQARAEVDKAVLVQKSECARKLKAYEAAAARAQERAVTKIRTDANRTIAEQKSQFERQIRAYKRKTTQLWDRKARQTRTEVKTEASSRKTRFRRKGEIHKRTPRNGKNGRRKVARAEKKSKVQTMAESTAIQSVATESVTTDAQIRMQSDVELDKIITSIQRIAYCECCFRNGVAEDDLVRIDSGQRLCPSCMKALEAKEAEIDRQRI